LPSAVRFVIGAISEPVAPNGFKTYDWSRSTVWGG
jgi:hypothetical protein